MFSHYPTGQACSALFRRHLARLIEFVASPSVSGMPATVSEEKTFKANNREPLDTNRITLAEFQY